MINWIKFINFAKFGKTKLVIPVLFKQNFQLDQYLLNSAQSAVCDFICFSNVQMTCITILRCSPTRITRPLNLKTY